VRDLTSKGISVQARGAMVDTGKDTGIIHLQNGPRETRERPPDSRNLFGIDPEGCVVAESARINRNAQTRVVVR
jgi:hypothetical protein